MRIAVLIILLAVAFSVPPSWAARRSAGLEQRLSALGPGDSVAVLLQFSDRADLAAFGGRRADGRVLIETLRAHADRSQGRVRSFLRARGLGERLQEFWIDNSIAVRVPVALLPALERFGELDVIEFDEPVSGFRDTGARGSALSTEWNIPIVRADQVWSTYGLDGTGVVVGSMDTGVDANHPALQGKWRGGTNSWRDLVGSSPTPYDDHGHGTHTIGTMVGGDGPGPFASDIGLAYNAKFIAVKVLDASNSFSSSSTVIGGAQWMLDPDGNPATDDFPDVINNSWLFNDPLFQGFHSSVAAWRAVGIIPVFCMGNAGPGSATTRAPGNYDNTIGVGATDSGDLIASFSSRGPSPTGGAFPADQRKPDLSAPGASVRSSIPGGGYSYWFGTSMASPHVAGTVALMLQAHPQGMSFDEIRSALIETAADRGAAGYDYDFGYGRLDAFAAVTRAMNPTAHVTGVASDQEVHLSWTAVPGAIRYDVYRSPEAQDLSPQLIGSTTGTTYVDPDRFGLFYYRLRTVSAAGASPFTNEAAVTACGLGAPNVVASDGSTAAPVVADFNGDGALDVAAPSLPTSTVKVALGDGAGHFGPVASFPAGSRPAGVAVGDFDADGILDLAVTNNVTPGALSILRGNGSAGVSDGTFAAPVAYATGARPVGVACGDFDQNGVADLAVACHGGNSISILLGNGAGGIGDGTFAAAVDHAASTKPTDIVIGDFNHDGAQDVATTANGASRVSVLLGNRDAVKADGTFSVGTPAFCKPNPSGIATGDFNADGWLDLAVACNLNPGYVSILLGRESGAGESVFANSVDYPAGALPQGIAAADLNGDGIADLAVGDATTEGAVAALLGTGGGAVGDGGFEPPTLFRIAGSPAGIAIADFDRDGAPDLAIANVSSTQCLSTMLASCGSQAGTGLTLLAPNGGETWPVSTVQTISWAKGPGVVSVDLDVSRDSGVTWRKIATRQIGTSYAWTVTDPSTATPSARIRVSDLRVSEADGADAGFTIGPDYRIDVPVGAEGSARLALAVENPAVRGLRVRFRLGPAPSATLDVMDVGGRRVLTRAVGGLGAGEHALDLGPGLRPGIYVVRLTQGEARVTGKAAVVR